MDDEFTKGLAAASPRFIKNLYSDDEESILSGLKSVVALHLSFGHKEFLLVTVGFIITKIKTSEDVIKILKYINLVENYEIALHLLKIISKDKEIHKKRLFVNEFLKYLSFNLHAFSETQQDNIKAVINASKWGQKTKNNFLRLFEIDYF